ncbi:hypothetical protein NX059_004914 [Plenodomus lindquistii]|nr:hypothetical protein NX059_004914 [Plenodomus lindquistii]
MHFSTRLLSYLTVLPTIYALRFEGPLPTGINPERAFDIAIPEPTQGPLIYELKKRQTNFSPETCGWVDGDWSSGVTCRTGRTCMLYTSSAVGMAGCCAGSDTQVCGWSNQCVDYSAYAAGDCGANCQADDFVRKCSDVNQPYCVTWTYPGDRVADYGCAATSKNTILTVLQRATDGVGGSTSMRLPTVSGGAVTGFSGGASGTTRAGTASTTRTSFGGGSSSSGSGSRTHRVKKMAVGTIIGIVVAALALVFFVVVGVCICVKKKKKQRQLAKDAQTIAAMQASRPQSVYPPPQQQQMQQQGPPPPVQQQDNYLPPPAPQSPQPTLNGYFSLPAPHPDEQKYNRGTSVHECAATPISDPSSPAPGYVQLDGDAAVYYQNTAAGPINHQSPAVGSEAHEVDAMSRSQVPGNGRAVYELGDGR